MVRLVRLREGSLDARSLTEGIGWDDVDGGEAWVILGGLERGMMT